MNRRNQALNNGDRVEVYRNLHKDCFSVRKNGKVVKHLLNCEELYLQNVSFAVQPAGRAKVMREGKKNVHAYVRGTVIKAEEHDFVETFKEKCTQEATYNPYKFDTFVTQAWSPNPCRINRANLVTFSQGKVYASV